MQSLFSASVKLVRALRQNAWWLVLLALYTSVGLVVLRLDFGTSGYPAGTNALDEFLVFYQSRKFGLGNLWYNLTDWGQPYPGFTGPTVLWPVEALASPSVGVRIVEFTALVLSGLSASFVCWRVSSSRIAAGVGGLYYLFAVQTSQFFDGHVDIMISFLIAPLFFYLVYVVFTRPTISNSLTVGFLLFVLGSVGDLGALYMILFFGVAIGLFAIAVRLGKLRYSRSELLAIGLGVLLLVLLSTPFLLSYSAGLRPEYTTNVTSNIRPFADTAGINIFYAFTGFIADNSYTLYSLGNPDYSLLTFPFELIYLAVPVWVLLYIAVSDNWKLGCAYLGALFSIMVSTGDMYQFTSGVNAWLYGNVPYFNSSPSLFRWNFFTDFVYAVVLSLAVRDFPRWWTEFQKHLRLRGLSLPRGRKVKWSPPASVRDASGLMVAGAIVVALVVLQNGEILTSPPTTFEFPSAELGAYNYIAHTPSRGMILTIPFGDTGSRSSWGGVSQSSIFMSPALSGVSSVMFQAGTPQSLAMDWFIGNGLTYGLSNNITKFLAATNIEYIAATKFQNWTFASDPVYYPPESYYALQNQSGLGSPVFSDGNQTVYNVSGYAGNVSFSTRYIVYYGNSSLLYSILNAPWYSGASTPLINGSLLGSQELDVDSHASAIVVSPSTLQTLSPSLLTALAGHGVPVDVLTNTQAIQQPGAVVVPEPWTSSNGEAFRQTGPPLSLVSGPSLRELNDAGYDKSQVYARAEIPPLAGGYITVGGTSLNFVSNDSVLRYIPLPWTNLSRVSAGINNQGKYPYNGSVNLTSVSGNTYLDWHFAPNNSTFQSLNFQIKNLSGATGLTLQIRGKAPTTILCQILFNNTFLNVWGESTYYQSVNSSTVVFYLPQGSNSTGPNFRDFENSSENVTLVAIGLTQSPLVGTLLVSNVSAFQSRSTSPSFQYQQLVGEAPISPTSYTITSTAGNLYDFIEIAFLPMVGSTSRAMFASDFQQQQSVASFGVSIPLAGWGALTLDQIWTPNWELEIGQPSPTPVQADIGLTSWILNFTNPIQGSIDLAAATAYATGLWIEGVGVPVFCVFLAVLVHRRRRSRLMA